MRTVCGRLPPRRGRTFERVTATDVIEHIPKADGYKLIEHIERIASREIFLMMPIETPELAATQEFQDFREWGLSQHPDGQRELHDHKSQWTPEDLNALGYQTAVLENFHGHDGFRFDAFVAVKCKDGPPTGPDHRPGRGVRRAVSRCGRCGDTWAASSTSDAHVPERPEAHLRRRRMSPSPTVPGWRPSTNTRASGSAGRSS